MQKIAIIIPCYNEAGRIDERGLALLAAQPDLILYLANDGSTDETLSLLSRFSAAHPDHCVVLNYAENQGKAMTIYKSAHHILSLHNADYIGYFDADFATPVNAFLRLINEIRTTSASFAFGSRILLLNAAISRKWHRHVIGRIIVTFIDSRFKLGIYDTQCGAKLFSAAAAAVAFEKEFQTEWLFDVEIFLRLKKHGMLAGGIEFPIREWRDVAGSKLGWKMAAKIIFEIRRLMRHY